jgi:hypothetical protein
MGITEDFPEEVATLTMWFREGRSREDGFNHQL